MGYLSKLWKSIFARELSDDIQQELETHLHLLEEEQRANGMNPIEAISEARRRFGNPSRHFETTLDVSVARWFNDLLQDCRFSCRQVRKNTSFAAVAILVIGLGIGAVTTICSLVNAVLLRPLPYGDPSRLVYLWTPNPHFGGNAPRELAPNYPDFYDWRRMSHSFSSMALLRQRTLNLGSAGKVARVGSAFVTGDFFHTLEVKPHLGRAIQPADDIPGHSDVAVISDRLWHARFSASPAVIGKRITLNRDEYTIVGVMPKSFGYPFEGDIPYVAPGFGQTDIWAPLALSAGEKTDRVNFQGADAAVARLRPGASLQQAQTELEAMQKRLDLLYSGPLAQGWQALVVSLQETILGPVTWLLLGAVALVLLIACGNVANLLLARVTGRLQEIALRAGLGAGRTRLMRQLFTESLVLALLGGCLGVLLSFGAVRLLARLNPGNIPRFAQTSVNLHVLAVAAAITLLSGGIFSLAPMLAALRPSLSDLLRQGGNKGTAGTSSHLRHSLIAVEVALSFILLIGATLLIRSYIKLQTQDDGFSSDTLTMSLPLDGRYSKPEQRTAFFMRFLESLRHLPGVIEAGAGDDIPLDHSESIGPVQIKGHPDTHDLIDSRVVIPGYIGALGMHLLSGRYLNQRDVKEVSTAVIVNRAFVKTYLRGVEPLGAEVRMGPNRPWSQIVGAVEDVRHSTLEGKPRPAFFWPYRPGFNAWNLHYALCSKLPPDLLVPPVRKVLHDLDPALALDDIHTMGERVAEASAQRRFQMVLMTSFAGLTVFLAMIGIYGVMAYAVRQRTTEIGLRLAIGASPRQVLFMIGRQGLTLVLLGLGGGVAVALLLTRALRSWLYGVPANDPLTFILIPLLILAVAGCACLIPAMQAARIDPAIALRDE
ncbi:MAG: ABC transporter permease [Acidobacteriota bacterium]|nr:ABC transporter permease [Acidobacteriota bacterium]